MARRRFFVDRVHDGRAELAGDEARHLSRVLRAAPGQRYEISDNQALYLAEIAEVSAQRVVFRVLEPLEFAAPPVAITLLAALIKFDRFEWIVEKPPSWASPKSSRWIASAAKRAWPRRPRNAGSAGSAWRGKPASNRAASICRRSPRPAIQTSYRAASQISLRAGRKSGRAAAVERGLSIERHHGDTVALAVGPEGGWTDDERSHLASAGFTAVSAGFQIMRTETAAISALAVLTNAWLAPIRIEA